MRISDWSSDVCSSDLQAFEGRVFRHYPAADLGVSVDFAGSGVHVECPATGFTFDHAVEAFAGRLEDDQRSELAGLQEVRSEEHTSELQSLMRISYAVFCLTKKTLQADVLISATIHTLSADTARTIVQ